MIPQTNKIICGDCRETMRQWDDECIDMVITSPPYWSLRDYKLKPLIWDGDENCEHKWGDEIKPKQKSNWDTFNKYVKEDDRIGSGKSNTEKQVSQGNFCFLCGAWKGQLGLEPTFDLYIKHLCDIFDEVKRVLKKEGSIWVNMGDTYNSTQAGNKEPCGLQQKTLAEREAKALYQRYKANVPSKSLCCIPERFKIEMINRGWVCRNTIIWAKPNPMPSSAKDRFTVDFEYLFFFVKNKKYYFEQQFEDMRPESYRKIAGDLRLGREKTTSKYYNTGYDAGERLVTEKMLTSGRNMRCVWTIPTMPCSEAHFAVFPEKLLMTPIKAGCPEGGIVLDLFAGRGTTGIVAQKLGRKYILIDLSREYCGMAKKNLSQKWLF